MNPYRGVNPVGKQKGLGRDLSVESLMITGLTEGSVLFAGPGGLVSEDNAKLWWDNTDKSLAVGPRAGNIDTQYSLVVTGDQANARSALNIRNNPGVSHTDHKRVFSITDEAFTFQPFVISLSSDVVGLDTGNNYELRIGTNNKDLNINVGAVYSINAIGIKGTTGDVNLPQKLRIGDLNTPTNTLEVNGNSLLAGNTTIGDAAGDVLTTNVGTLTQASNIQWNRAIGAAAPGAQFPIRITETFSGDAAGSSTVTGLLVEVQSSGSNPTTLVGFRTVPQTNSTNIAGLIGYRSNFNVLNSGNVTEAANFEATTSALLGTGVISNLYGLAIRNQGHASLVINNFGVAIVDQTESSGLTAGIKSGINSGTNKWNIYADGTAPNYFGGQLRAGSDISISPVYSFNDATGHGIHYYPLSNTNQFGLVVDGGAVVSVSGPAASNGSGLVLRSLGVLRWSADGNVFEGAGSDLLLFREAAGILAQRNGPNSQHQHLYATFTDATNFERLEQIADTTMYVRTNQAGTGVARALALGTVGNAPVQLFQNNAVRWFVDTDQHFKAGVDNTNDIGAPGALRPRTGYFGTSLIVAGNTVWHVGNDGAASGLDADLLDGQQGSYYLDSANFTGTNWTDLTDAGDTTLHFHSADRARANHTGTQLFATISDVSITATNLNILDDGVDTTLHFHATDRARANHTGTQDASTIGSGTMATARLGSGTASASTFLRGDQTWAAPSPTGFTLVKKTADEQITNDSTLSADNTLLFAMSANTKYKFRFKIYVTSQNTPDFKWRLVGPASPSLILFEDRSIITATGGSDWRVYSAYNTADVVLGFTDGTHGIVEIEGIVHNGANAGNLSFDWAQNVSNAGATTVRAGSVLEYSSI